MTENAQDVNQLKGDDLLRSIEEEHSAEELPDFSPGDTLEVGLRIKEGDVSRVQNFTGTCIGRKGSGARETFTVRRIVQGQGVERIFPVSCPTIDHIKVIRRGKVRRAKLTYLRERTGRSAKVKGRV